MSTLHREMDISNLKQPLSATRQRILIEKAQAGDKQALELVTEHNMRMVVRIAANFCKRSGRDLETAVADGAVGLHGAIMRFDLSRGFRFSTFAYPTIENAMKWTPDPVEVSLDAPMGEDGDLKLADLIPDTRPRPDEEVHDTVLREELERLMSAALNEREAKLLQNYYGWHKQPMSFRELAKAEGISGTRTTQIIRRAEGKLYARYRLRKDEFLLALEA